MAASTFSFAGTLLLSSRLGHGARLYEKGIKFVLYTGRAPRARPHRTPCSMDIHQASARGVDTRLYFQMTDDEKIRIDDEAVLSETTGLAYENALD